MIWHWFAFVWFNLTGPGPETHLAVFFSLWVQRRNQSRVLTTSQSVIITAALRDACLAFIHSWLASLVRYNATRCWFSAGRLIIEQEWCLPPSQLMFVPFYLHSYSKRHLGANRICERGVSFFLKAFMSCPNKSLQDPGYTLELCNLSLSDFCFPFHSRQRSRDPKGMECYR